MGFLDNNSISSTGSQDKLDLVEYECSLARKFNDSGLLTTKFMSEEFGLSYNKKISHADVYLYEGNEEIVICPEPLEFLKEFDDVSDNTSKAHELFLKKIETFQRIKLDSVPKLKGSSEYRMWMNKTLTGINLRPGNLNDDRDKFDPIRMCDDNVHGLIAGRTGSGKSVFINALILSLITEYSPWELNLYLADFKKVELSRYMNNADAANDNIPFTPHVNACAATSEIRYVTSLIKYLVDCMNARQEFFARLGVTKIQEFRNKYGLVLPRVLLIVDEFQQLFTEATNREKEEIQTMLNSITKLGRATGFHLIFASQEMSGTLRGNTLANFKIRMCLPCTQQISTDILGNSRAVELERGYVLINTDSGDELKNQKYRVPFIETDKKDDADDDSKTAFYLFLDEIKLASKQFDLRYKTLSQKFYREELQETESAYRSDLESIRERKNELVSKNSSLFDAIILGKTVLYSPKPNDKVSFYIEKGRNKGIMIACPEPDNAARVRKLITENLIRSADETYHIGMELNNLVLERYRIDKEISGSSIHKYFQCDVDSGIETLELVYYLRVFARKYIDNNGGALSGIKESEASLERLLQDESLVSKYKERKEKYSELLSKLSGIDEKISERNKNNKKLISPIIKYLEKCSDIPFVNGKVDFINLSAYKDITSAFINNLDLCGAANKAYEIIESKIKAISKHESQSLDEKNKDELHIKQYKIFRRAIIFFVDKYLGKESEKTSVSEFLQNIYAANEKLVNSFKKEYEARISSEDELKKLTDERDLIQGAIEELEATPNDLETAEKDIIARLTSFVSFVFDSSYIMLGYKKNKPTFPGVTYFYDGSNIKWLLDENVMDQRVQLVAADVLERFISWYRQAGSSQEYKKIVFWINGLDEIEKIPNQLVEIIRNAINQNILVISIITSELKDTTVRKAFDYAFVTGNIEKFYSMFNIKYTKQPLDSIVVNFGIRSKGFDIPFKMYKSNLEEIQAPNFIDQLLNA